jgi:ABC-type transport system involved in multi-copper enzyme maturation permease subunit
VTGALVSEWIKFSRRPSSWILAVAMLGVVVGVGYFLLYLVFHFTPASPNFPEPARKALLRVLYPDRFVANVLNTFTGIGGAMVLILGALSLGGEYGWSTLKTALTLKPGRLTFMAAKLLLLALVVVAFVALLLSAGAVASFAAALLDGADVAWPPASEMLRGLATGSLILAVWCAFGLCLAAVFRSNALPIGIGLVYLLLVEGILGGFRQVDAVRSILRLLPAANAGALIESFGSVNVPGAAAPEPIAGAGQAALVLAAYLVVFLAVTVALVWRRDVT